MATEQKEHWSAFHDSLDPELTLAWSKLSTEPKYEKGTWKSVFLTNETAGKRMFRCIHNSLTASVYSHLHGENTFRA